MCPNVGSEQALKAELRRLRPNWHLAYSRPGFITFKAVDGRLFGPTVRVPGFFARVYGACLFKAGRAELPGRLEELLDGPEFSTKFRLHVFSRIETDSEAQSFASAAADDARAVLAERFYREAVPVNGDMVIDVVAVCKDEIWVGSHRHYEGLSPFPGGRPMLDLPPEAPSRSYLKMKEALLLTGAPLRHGDTALEIGSSPGGSSYCLLQTGINVIGVDAGRMDQVCICCTGAPWFRHLACQAGDVRLSDLSAPVQWLVLDINARPAIALAQLHHIVSLTSTDLIGAFLTLKINDERTLVQLSSAIRRVRNMGFSICQARQLYYSRNEVFIYCLTPLGLQRVRGSRVLKA